MTLTKGLNTLTSRDNFKGDVKIIKKSKPGPVVFIVSNGLGAIEAVIKDSNFKMGDVVYLEGKVNEHRGKLQIEIDEIRKSSMDFDAIITEKSRPERTEFSIKSERYEKMKPVMLAIATRVRRAILEGQPIMIRHHNDADGVTSGLSLEHACYGLMQDLGIDGRYLLFRSPSKAPFYAAGDVLRDMVLSKKLIEVDDLKPLIIVADNGSTPEDAFGLNVLKSLGYEAIVIDHHNPIVLNNGVTAIDGYVSHHLNPYKHGLDSKTSAGMLCYEIGRFIWERLDEPKMPAVAGILDRCDIQETEDYIAKSGLDRAQLLRMGTAIDYISYQLKHDAGKGVFEQVYESTAFVDLINEEVRKGFETQLQSTLPYLRNQEINGILLSTIDIDKYTMKFTFPATGGVVSRIHEINIKENEGMPVFTFGYLVDSVTMRASHPILPSQVIFAHLKEKFPNANVDGGGHEMAATVRFVSAFRDEILEEIKNMVRELKREEA
jgi:RecJ-like exonuclease